MKKKRITLSLLLSTTTIPTIFAVSCGNPAVTSQKVDSLVNPNDNEANSYITIQFSQEDKDVKFEGPTTIKVRAGKLFGQISHPVAKKPNAEFDHWYYYNMDTKEQVTVENTTPLTTDLEIYPFFQSQEPSDMVRVEFNLELADHETRGKLVQGDTIMWVPKGTIFDDIPKPIVDGPVETEPLEFWSLDQQIMTKEPTDSIPPYYVVNDDTTFYACYVPDVVFDKSREDIYGCGAYTLNFTAASDNASIKWVREGNYGEDKMPTGVGYWNMETPIEDGFTIAQKNQEIAIPKGETICVAAGDLFTDNQWPDMQPTQFSVDQEHYSHFVINGDIWISGTLAGLNCDGLRTDGSLAHSLQDNKWNDRFWSDQHGQYCYYKLFANATQNPGSQIHIAKSVLYQREPFMPHQRLAESCYESMFEGTNIVSVPPGLFKCNFIPQEEYQDVEPLQRERYSYKRMFANCTKLESIPSNVLWPDDRCIDEPKCRTPFAEQCFLETFAGCTSLFTIPNDFFAYAPYEIDFTSMMGMFNDCRNLFIVQTDSPILGLQELVTFEEFSEPYLLPKHNTISGKGNIPLFGGCKCITCTSTGIEFDGTVYNDSSIHYYVM